MKHGMTYVEAIELTVKYHELEKLYRETWKEPKSKERERKLVKIEKELSSVYDSLPKFCH